MESRTGNAILCAKPKKKQKGLQYRQIQSALGAFSRASIFTLTLLCAYSIHPLQIIPTLSSPSNKKSCFDGTASACQSCQRLCHRKKMGRVTGTICWDCSWNPAVCRASVGENTTKYTSVCRMWELLLNLLPYPSTEMLEIGV